MYQSNIVELAKELERLKQNSKDIIAPTNRLRAVAVEITPAEIVTAIPPTFEERAQGIRAPMPKIQPALTPDKTALTELRLEVKNGTGQDYGTFPLTRHGSLQLADKVGIPRKYYEAMLNAGMTQLTADNVNSWLAKNAQETRFERRLVRVADNHVRAILSDRYRMLDNLDLAYMTMQRAKQHEAVVNECSLTETRMYVKLVVPNFREAIKQGDDVVPGLVVSNSEVGDGAFRVEPFLYRLACVNGLIGMTSLYKVHLGQRMELGELIFKDDTRASLDTALWSQVRDVIDSTFDKDILRAFIAKFRGALDIPVDNVKETVDATAKNLALSDSARDDLLMYFSKENSNTVYGLVNGITRLAQDFQNYDEQIRLQRFAGELLEQKVPAQ